MTFLLPIRSLKTQVGVKMPGAKMLGAKIIGARLVGLLACLLIVFSFPAYANTDSPSRIVPFERMLQGQYTIEVRINDSEPLKFMIDTAASRSSIFNKTKLKLGLDTSAADKFINGMTNSSYRPTSNVETLSFGREVFKDHNIIILKDWDKAQAEGLDGILGMDVFRGSIFAFSHKTSTVKISKRPRFSKSKYNRWKKIRLEGNPYPVEKFGLLFTYTQLGDLHIPTLLDTGSNFSAINWMSVSDTSISKERRRLREEWTVQGSIGEFKPRMRVLLAETYIGGVKLKNHEFLVMNFDNFPINKYGAYPLVIAGVDLFSGRDFTLDFVNNDLYIAPKPRNLRIGMRSSRIERQVDE